jgi:ribosomal protein S6--L-glutamate ligase
VILLGGKIKGAMVRKAPLGDFRTNFSLNREVDSTTLSKKEIKQCEDIAKFMDLEYCGVDFIRTQDGPIFLEVNGMPGYTGMNITFEKRGENFFEEFIKHMASL